MLFIFQVCNDRYFLVLSHPESLTSEMLSEFEAFVSWNKIIMVGEAAPTLLPHFLQLSAKYNPAGHVPESRPYLTYLLMAGDSEKQELEAEK
jgi:hypothetical protein